MLLLSLLMATTADWAGVRGKRLGVVWGLFVVRTGWGRETARQHIGASMTVNDA